MRITVIADSAGSIVGFSYDPPGHVHASGPATALVADEDQTLHAVDLTPELMQRLGDESFADEVYRHVVVKKGKTALLSRATPGKR